MASSKQNCNTSQRQYFDADVLEVCVDLIQRHSACSLMPILAVCVTIYP